EDADWWRAWGAAKQPVNTALVEGEKAFGGKGKSLQVTVPRGEHTGTTFGYKFRQRIGAEPEEIYFRYYLKFDPDWRNATSGGKLPGISGPTVRPAGVVGRSTARTAGRPAVSTSPATAPTRRRSASTATTPTCAANTARTLCFSRGWSTAVGTASK